MTRLVNRAIEVTVNSLGEPVSFVDREHNYSVMLIQDWWSEAGEWWNGESHRNMYRVLTTDTGLGIGVFELQYNDGEWRIYRVWD